MLLIFNKININDTKFVDSGAFSYTQPYLADRVYELDDEDRKSLLAEYREWIMNDLDSEEVMMLPYEAYTDNLDPNYLDDLL